MFADSMEFAGFVLQKSQIAVSILVTAFYWEEDSLVKHRREHL